MCESVCLCFVCEYVCLKVGVRVYVGGWEGMCVYLCHDLLDVWSVQALSH